MLFSCPEFERISVSVEVLAGTEIFGGGLVNERDRHRQTEKETDRQTQTDRERDRQTQTDRERETQTEKETDTERDKDRETDTERQTKGQTQTDRERETEGSIIGGKRHTDWVRTITVGRTARTTGRALLQQTVDL